MLYAWRTQTKIVVKNPEYVFRHDKKLMEYDLSFMNANNPKQLYDNLSFSLAVTSLLLCPGNVANVRESDGEVHIITKGNRKVSICPDEVLHFDKETSLCNVYDFYDTREMTRTDIRIISDLNEDFVYQINLYNSPRADHNRSKDVVAASRMTLEQLLSPDYGQGIAMLKILRMFKSEGIKGKFAWERKGRRYYKRPKLEFYRRVTSPILETKYSFDEVYKINQQKEKAWKTLETLRKKGETL
jgi:hypothetical protein